MDRHDEAAKRFHEVIKTEPNNLSALTSLGFLAREQNDDKAAQEYFTRLVKSYPNDHVAYLALGTFHLATSVPKSFGSVRKSQ